MKRWVTAWAVLLVHAGVARADTPLDVCRAPLARDAYSLDFSTFSETHYRSALKSLLCDSSNRSRQSAMAAGISAIIPGYEVPVSGSYANSSSEVEAQRHCEEKIDAVSLDQIDKITEKIVDNSASLAAFNKCIDSLKGGFYATLLQPGHRVLTGESFTIVASWKPNGPSSPITLGDLLTDNATCDPRSQIKAGTQLKVNGTIKAQCKRLTCRPVTISLTDNDQMDAPEIYMDGLCAPQCDGKDVNLATNPNNCGACNHNCLGACESGTCRSYKLSTGASAVRAMPDLAAQFALGNLRGLGRDARARIQGALTVNFTCKTFSWSDSPFAFQLTVLANGKPIASQTFSKAPGGPKHSNELLTINIDSEVDLKADDILAFTATALPTANWCYRSGKNPNPPDESNVQSFSAEIISAHNPKAP